MVSPLLDDPAALEVVVVVDGCHDGSLELLEELAARSPKLRPVMLSQNVGTARARLEGASACHGDVVLSLDDDVIAAPGLVTGHRRHHASGQGRVVLGYMPIALPPRRRPGHVGTWEYATSYEEHCRSYEQEPGAVLTNFWGGNFSVPRRALLDAQPQVLALPRIYHEDTILGLVFRRAGLEPVFDRALRAEHRYERSFAAYLRDARRMGASHPVLHAAFADLIGPYRFDHAASALGRRKRPLVRLADRPRARPLVLALLRALVLAAGRLRALELELRLARIAIRIEDRRGAREVAGS